MPEPGQRLRTLDAVRGVAVLGILLLNIVDFAMPACAYQDPTCYGGNTGANWWTWAIVYVVADAKMRGLFTLLFGASTVLIAERALAAGENPARVHYARMATLLLFGLAHAYLIWAGDILTLYAVAGALAFAAWRWRPALLLTVAALLLAFKLANGLTAYHQVRALEIAAASETATPDTLRRWADFAGAAGAPRAAVPDMLAAHRGSWADAFRARVADARIIESYVLPDAFLDTLALVLAGMALFRLGFFSGAWPPAAYRLAALAIPLWWLAYVPLVLWLQRTGFSPVTSIATETIQLTLLRPWLSLGYAALVILLVRSGHLSALVDRLAAAGRMAFSNYLGTSLVCTAIFDGWGLGWYGHLSRWQCYLVVAIVWLLILAWSRPWLARFRYGPFEWAWRSLARLSLQPMRKAANASH